MQRKPLPALREVRSKRRLQLVHTDVCGLIPTKSIGGNKYFITFVADYSRCCAVYCLKNKAEVLNKFKQFERRVAIDSCQNIASLQSYNGGEYLSLEFDSYMESKGIHHELIVPYSPEQNGVAERMNRTLLESVRSMMFHAGLPNRFRAEVVECAAYIRNNTSTSAIKGNKTPFEVLSGNKPDVSHLKVFGCMEYTHVPDAQRHKLDKKAVKLRFIGYSIQSKGYRLLDKETSLVYIRRDVVFNEQNFGHGTEGASRSSSPQSVEVQPSPDVLLKQEEKDEPMQRRQSERIRQHPVRYGIDEYVDTAADSIQQQAYSACQIIEPQTMEEALAGDCSEEWK